MTPEKLTESAEQLAKDMRLSPTERADLVSTAKKLAAMGSDDLRNFAEERRQAAFTGRGPSNPARNAEMVLATFARETLAEEMPPPPGDDAA